MKKFNVGEAVYYPRATNKVLRLKDTNKSLTTRDLQVELGNISGGIPATFYKNGVHLNHGKAQEIFHATQENYELLSKLYPNVEFEPPPKRKEPKEIIQAMLDAGHKYVLCDVYNSNDWSGSEYSTVAIIGFNGDKFESGEDTHWDTAEPINSKGQKIIDFVDGKEVLENEND